MGIASLNPVYTIELGCTSFFVRDWIALLRCAPSVSPSTVGDIVFYATSNEEIPRLRLGMTITVQSLAEECWVEG
jgi:hypothetical protein